MALNLDLTIEKGKTFSRVVRWETEPIIYKPISAITQTAPATLTVVGHGLTDGWRVAVVSVKGMTQINAQNTPPREREYHKATVVDVDTIELNDVNAANFKAYTSGGYIQYNTPADLAGFVARMSIKDKVGGTELLRLDTTNGRISINDSTKTITLTLSAGETEAITWKRGVYDLELEAPDGTVTALLAGKVNITEEVTTT